MISQVLPSPTASASAPLPHQGRTSNASDQPDALLSPIEFLVYRQLTCPNQEALSLAAVDAHRGRTPKGPVKVDITPANLAAGIGMSLELFEQLHTSIREKVAHHMSLQPHEQAHHSAVVALEKIFDVHVPRSAEPLVVRRIFTIKARADYQKVTPEIAELLKTVGAKPPVMDANRVLNCYGILWENGNPVCRNCDLNDACRAEAANVGLVDVALSQKLLPANAKVRTATKAATDGNAEVHVAPEVATSSPARASATKPPPIITSSVADEELLRYVEENFRGFYFQGNRYYTHKSNPNSGAGVVYLFWIGHKPDNGPLRLRFCKPLPKMKEKLEKVGHSFYLPLNAEPKLVEKLTEKHADERRSK